ncbi:MAG: SLAP domain-containing protein, partial [Lysinibacillus sp.]
YKGASFMQQLVYHPAWEKQLSHKDRQIIEDVFEATYDVQNDILETPFIRADFNHKGQLLVMVLIHNFTHRAIGINNKFVQLSQGDFFCEQQFTLPTRIAAFSSMPWTFIFEPNEAFEALDLSKLNLEIDTF